MKGADQGECTILALRQFFDKTHGVWQFGDIRSERISDNAGGGRENDP